MASHTAWDMKISTGMQSVFYLSCFVTSIFVPPTLGHSLPFTASLIRITANID